MVYRRGKRPSFYFEAKLRVGYKQLCTDTSDRKTAQRTEHVWATLADQRAWDLLEPIIAELPLPKSERTHTIGGLLDLWNETNGDVAAMRRKLADVDLEPLVPEWADVFKTKVGADWAAHALVHVRHFFPEGTPRLASSVTADWITTRLAEYPGKRNTRRKVHSSLSVFLDYCVLPKRVLPFNPMAHVDRPARELLPPTFYDRATVDRIVAWQPTEARRAFFALVYGTGADVSPAVLVEREAIDPGQKRVRIAGTKTKHRDRTVRVADWAWPIFWRYAKTILHGRVFPAEWNRWTVSDWHRQTVGDGVKDTHGNVEQEGLKLAKRLPLRRARHHYAVRMLAAGAPARLVAEQLGSSERVVNEYYGPFVPSAADWDKWEKAAERHEKRRRTANGTANHTNAGHDGPAHEDK